MRRRAALGGLASVLMVASAAGAATPRTFVVYFPWGEAVLTDDGRRVVRAFAEFRRSGEVSRAVVVGHTDTSGEDIYNGDLSLRRAEAVAAELVRLGVDPAAVTVEGRGEAQPAVATPDGVREPLNRRAEIVWLK